MDIVIAVSTTFYPGWHRLDTDLVFSSIDGVLFYLHTDFIHQSSPTALDAFLQSSTGRLGEIVVIPEPATVLTILLYALYRTSISPSSPSTDDLIVAIDKMPSYSMVVQALVTPNSPLHDLLLLQAPLRPLDIYALAAHHRLSELAVRSSLHLLGFPLETISDAMAVRIGPTYLRRLFVLQMMRTQTLGALLRQPLRFHPPTKSCDIEWRKKLGRAWELASAHLLWTARPGASLPQLFVLPLKLRPLLAPTDISCHHIQDVFEPLANQLACSECAEMFRKRIRSVLTCWASVRVRVFLPSTITRTMFSSYAPDSAQFDPNIGRIMQSG